MNHRLAIVAAVMFAFALGFADRGAGPAGADGEKKTPEYVGAKSCKKCHFKQQKTWKKTALASAFEVLKPGQCEEKKKAAGLDLKKDYTKDAKCLKCHATGYGTASGYPTLTEGKEFSEAEKVRAGLNEGVTCEACHGPGSLYIPVKKANKEYKREEIVALGALAPVTADNCSACHVLECPTMPKDYKFDFEAQKASDKLHAHKALKSKH